MKNDTETPTEKDLVPGFKHIVIAEGHLGGKPAILGKRISIRQILEGFANGMSFDDFYEAFALEKEVLVESLQFAAQFAGDKDVVNRRKSGRAYNVALKKLTELRSVILEHILKIVIMPNHEAVNHWQKEINSYQTRLCRYHKGKGSKPNYSRELLWEYIWEDQIDELPMGFVEEYGVKNIQLNFDEVKSRINNFIDGIIS